MSHPTTTPGQDTTPDQGIALDARGIRFEGGPRLVLCASLFYFRLPREQWRARLAQVRASGYTCVDVYLPWNFHETAPGRWSFEGRRDVAAFLDLAQEEGLYVIARPGPYICSEWDGGALPAWLGLDPQLRVRQHEPRFLDRVTAWFDQALPLLAERQYPANGPVIMVQLENELDFFDCEDRTGYLSALRDHAVRHGITVPLIACSGQGDLEGATGDVPGVVPACNFYPDDDSPHIEPEVRRYAELLAERDLPLLITETNRRHRTLRRLLAGGASLIAPYLQSSGWNFGYTPSAGNWGRPGNLMSHGYDFGGYVSSTGTERPEYAEAQLLARVIDTLGPRLALAVPTVPHTPVTTDFPTSSSPSALRLDGGGLLLAVPHLGTRTGAGPGAGTGAGPGAGTGTAVVNGVPVAVAADSCPLMPVDVPLTPWGHEGTLTLASADLIAAGEGVLVFSSEVPVTVVVGDTRVEIPAPAPGAPQRATVAGLTLVALAPSDAVRLRSTDRNGTVRLEEPVPARPASAPVAVRRARRRVDTAVPERAAGRHEEPPTLESLGVYRGRGTYRTTTDLTGVDELLLAGASDIVDLTVAGRARPTIAGFGATRRIDVREATGSVDVEAVVEIWGHANFDDARLPALRLGALRGLGTVWTVRETTDMSALWEVHGHWAGRPAPLRELGGWSSTRVGLPVTYTREIRTATAAALHLKGLAEPVRVTVTDGEPRTLHAENPWISLPAGTHRISVTLPHHPSGGGLRAELLALDPVTDWTCSAQDDDLLTGFATEAAPRQEVEVLLPLSLAPGEEAWLDVDLPPSHDGLLLRPDGTQIRVTGWAGGECVGRVWIGDRPDFSGGDADVLWIPPGWSGLTLLVRGAAGPKAPELGVLRLESADS
ncbi:beta-galactosidase [Streptomyces sp. NRRL S-475]|uniref:beta-galactosidase n=1 Tax=Streptomyces sp. NRRL S-475 TaxID=1463910 RepID=UPI0006897834|nr:beta-galactosidase [Streptomyces sp. NRRL S-475]